MRDDFIYTITGFVEEGTIVNYPNTLLDFQTDEFEVCILDMLFMPGSWDNVRPGGNSIKYRTSKEDLNPTVFHVEPGNYVTRDALITALNNATGSVVLFKNSIDRQLFMDLVVDKKNGQIQFCKELAYLMSATTMLTMQVPWATHGWGVVKESIDPKRNNLVLLWLFGNFVRNTIIGNLQLPMIRFVPIKVGSGIMEHAIFSTQHYVKVKRKIFSKIEISFKETLNGGALNIHEPIAITLHFRRVQ